MKGAVRARRMPHQRRREGKRPSRGYATSVVVATRLEDGARIASGWTRRRFGRRGRLFGRPRRLLGGPKSAVGASKSHPGGPRSLLDGPKSHLDGPTSHVGRPKRGLGAPKSEFGGPKSDDDAPTRRHGGPKSDIGGPKSLIGGPKRDIGGPASGLRPLAHSSIGPSSSPDSTKNASPYCLRSSSVMSRSSWVCPRVTFTRSRSSPGFTDG
jgi:hypothetical protein